MRKSVFLYIILMGLFCTACHRAPQFTVEGNIPDAEMVYLVHTGLTSSDVVDSCKTNNGTFCLKGNAPATPELYRLNLGDRFVVLAVDSIETITIKGDSIFGSPASARIAELRQSVKNQSYEDHKAFAIRTIIEMPRTLAAYYAVFQKKQGIPVFDINDPQDRKFYQAVATSMQLYMPQSERTRILTQQVLDAINAERRAINNATMLQYIDDSENYLPEIALPNAYGDTCRLSDLKGKVILLDFSAIEMEQSSAYFLALRELYNQYSLRGLEIYSVSVDKTRLYWEDGVGALPWICVRTELAGPLLDYNVTAFPTQFIIDRQGNVQARFTGNFDAIEQEIKKWL